MQDRGAVQTCCYPDIFDPMATFDHTVDHILVKPKAKLIDATSPGTMPASGRRSGLWPSDHGGVVAKLKLKK